MIIDMDSADLARRTIGHEISPSIAAFDRSARLHADGRAAAGVGAIAIVLVTFVLLAATSPASLARSAMMRVQAAGHAPCGALSEAAECACVQRAFDAHLRQGAINRAFAVSSSSIDRSLYLRRRLEACRADA